MEIKWDAQAAEKGGYEHFMMKEIQEQPKAVKDTISSYVSDGRIDLSSVGLSDEEIREISSQEKPQTAWQRCGRQNAKAFVRWQWSMW